MSASEREVTLAPGRVISSFANEQAHTAQLDPMVLLVISESNWGDYALLDTTS
jgi:hypothetical protein